METYRCAYRDPNSPLTPLTPICDITLRKTFRDHSPSLIPIKKITLNDCPTPKRKRSTTLINHKPSPNNHPCAIKITLPVADMPEESKAVKTSNYFFNVKKILTPKSKTELKSNGVVPKLRNIKSSPPPSLNKRSRFTCLRAPTSDERPNSPRVLKILQDIGQEKYSDVFRKEEIDLDVFRLLTKSDLIKLGIGKENDIQVILKAVGKDN